MNVLLFDMWCDLMCVVTHLMTNEPGSNDSAVTPLKSRLRMFNPMKKNEAGFNDSAATPLKWSRLRRF